MTIYAMYEDDGPQGITPQSMQYTRPWCQLIILNNQDDLRLMVRHYEEDPPRSRKHPRISRWWSDNELDYGDEVFRATLVEGQLVLSRELHLLSRNELAKLRPGG